MHSARRDSNPCRPAWEASASRNVAPPSASIRHKSTKQSRSPATTGRVQVPPFPPQCRIGKGSARPPFCSGGAMSRRPLRVPQLDVDTPPRQPVSRPPDCVSSIPKLPPDPRKPEDVDTTSDDHAYDALTYFLLSRESATGGSRPAVASRRAVGATRMVASDACGCRHSDAIPCPACKQCGSHHHLGTACRVGFCPRC